MVIIDDNNCYCFIIIYFYFSTILECSENKIKALKLLNVLKILKLYNKIILAVKSLQKTGMSFHQVPLASGMRN